MPAILLSTALPSLCGGVAVQNLCVFENLTVRGSQNTPSVNYGEVSQLGRRPLMSWLTQ